MEYAKVGFIKEGNLWAMIMKKNPLLLVVGKDVSQILFDFYDI
jgi:hypothetical protein